MKTMFLLIACLILAACTPTQSRAPRPALIGHIVFVELQNPDDYPQLLADSDAMLGTIPSVSTFAAGRHIDTGRDTIINDYDLAIYLGFQSVEDLNAYVAHEQHIAYVNKWKPRLTALRIYDLHDPTP
ncbi:MAG: Dabb family protein [Phycisphaerales bacterium JB052]